MRSAWKKISAAALACLMLLMLAPAVFASPVQTTTEPIWATEKGVSILDGAWTVHEADTMLTTNKVHYCTSCEGVYSDTVHVFADEADHDGGVIAKEIGKASWSGAGQSLKFAGEFLATVDLTDNWQDLALEFDFYVPVMDIEIPDTYSYIAIQEMEVVVELTSAPATDNLEVFTPRVVLNDFVDGGIVEGQWNHVVIPLTTFTGDCPRASENTVKYQSAEYGLLKSDGLYHFDPSRCRYMRLCNAGNHVLPAGFTFDVMNIQFTGEREICLHDFDGTNYKGDESGHWQVCSYCGAMDETVKHTYGDYEVDGDMHSHTCTVCGYEGTEEHSYKPVMDHDDENHWFACRACGAKKLEMAHTWGKGEVVIPATETEEGITTYTCTSCGATKDEITPVLSGDAPTTPGDDQQGDDPATPDDPTTPAPAGNDNTLIIVVIAVAAAVVIGAVAVIVVVSKKK